MNLRKSIRDTARQGNFVYATVEAINLGLATVKLSNGSQRLSNLPVAGNISVGDTVIVDYAGSTPIVKPYADTVQDDQVQLEVAIETPAKSSDGLITREDIGVHAANATGYGYVNENFYVLPNTPTLVPFERYSEANFEYPSLYDTNDHLAVSGASGPTSITVQSDGRYIVALEVGFMHYGNEDFIIPNGYCQAKILKNGTETIAIARGGSNVNTVPNWEVIRPLKAITIAPLREGDELSLEIYHTWNMVQAAWNVLYGFPSSAVIFHTLAEEFSSHSYNGAHLMMQRIPGNYELAGDCIVQNGWTVPTDIPYEEAVQLCRIYHMLDGDNGTMGYAGDVWGTSETAGNWKGITVSGGRVTQIDIYFSSGGTGDVSDWDPSVFTDLTAFYIDQSDSVGPYGTLTWQFADGIRDIWIYNQSGSGTININFDNDFFKCPGSIQDFRIYGHTTNKNINVSGLPPAARTFDAFNYIDIENCTVASGYADDWMEYIYTNWSYFTAQTSSCGWYMYYCGEIPSGIYQNANPPTTGKEFEYKIENDPDATGNEIFTVGYAV